MSDLLIKNMELPEEGFYEVTICGSGRVFYHPLGRPDESKKTEAIVLAEHGDLVDRDEFVRVLNRKENEVLSSDSSDTWKDIAVLTLRDAGIEASSQKVILPSNRASREE